jgi:hypothetical protein
MTTSGPPEYPSTEPGTAQPPAAPPLPPPPPPPPGASLPGGPPSPYPAPSPYTVPAVPGPGASGMPVKTDGLAVASLVCSLVGILVGLAAILGIVFGFIARSRIRTSQGTTKGAGMALAGIIIGFVALVASIAIVAVIVSTKNSNSTSSAASSAIPSSADTALAQAQALTASDYPSGWSAQGASSTNTGLSFFGGASSSDLARATSCLGISSANVDTNPAEYAGQEYDDQNGGTMSENVEVYPTATGATADVAAVASPKVVTCVLQLFPDLGSQVAKGVGSGATAGTVTASAKSVSVPGGKVAGVELAIPITYQGTTNTVYVDMFAGQKGRSEAVMRFSSVGTSPDASLETQMLGSAMAKLTA